MALGWAFRNLRRVRKSPSYDEDKELQLWTGALAASLLGYMSGAMFASTEYNLFPYFMIAYTCAIYRIAFSANTSVTEPENGTKLQNGREKKKPEFAWSR